MTAYTFTGTLTEPTDGAPIVGARVIITGTTPRTDIEPAIVSSGVLITDEYGHFTTLIEQTVPDEWAYRIIARRDGDSTTLFEGAFYIDGDLNLSDVEWIDPELLTPVPSSPTVAQQLADLTARVEDLEALIPPEEPSED